MIKTKMHLRVRFGNAFLQSTSPFFFGGIILCKNFGFAKCVRSKVVECIFQICSNNELTFHWSFPGGFAGQGFLNKDPTVWLDEARPANTCIPPSLLGNTPVQLLGMSTPKKYSCKYEKIIKIWWNHFFIFKKSEKEFEKLNFTNSEFVKCEIKPFY